MTERECARLLAWSGTPLSCHLMLTAGPRARLGLLSPGDRPIERGDPFTIAYGIWGALSCRAGFVVEDAAELEEGTRDYVERLVAPYFAAVAEWYGALHVGQVGWRAAAHRRPPPGRPVLRRPPEPRATSCTWTSGSTRRCSRARASSCARAWRSSATSSRPPARRTSRPTSRTGWRWPTRRCGPSSPRPTPGRGSASRPGDGSWPTSSASTSTRTCCRSRTSPATCRRSSCARTAP